MRTGFSCCCIVGAVAAALIALAVVALAVDFILTSLEHRMHKWRPQQF